MPFGLSVAVADLEQRSDGDQGLAAGSAVAAAGWPQLGGLNDPEGDSDCHISQAHDELFASETEGSEAEQPELVEAGACL